MSRASVLKSFGSGEELLVAIPGFGCNASLFNEAIEHYQKRFHVLVYDISELDMPAEFELRSYAQILLNLLEEQGHFKSHKKFHLLGVSMGGFIAQIFASVLKCPDSLSLWCTQGPAANGFNVLHVIHNEDIDKLVHYDNYQIAYGSIKQTVCQKTYDNRELFLKLVDWKSKNLMPLEQLKSQNNAVVKYLKKSIPYQSIECPVHVMLSETDRLVEVTALARFSEVLSTSKLTLIEEYDHLFFKENPTLTHIKQDEFFNTYFS